MDRNTDPINLSDIPPVALRKESVDRNLLVPELHADGISSLSARRAWIEISEPMLNISLPKRRSPQGERG